MITVTMATVVKCDRSRVWEALTRPAEIVLWNHRLIEALDVPDEYPKPGQHVRWRYRLGTIPVTLDERIVEIRDGISIRAQLELGPLRCMATQTLASCSTPEATRVALKIQATNSVPVVGGIANRFDIRYVVSTFIDNHLRGLENWLNASDTSPADRAALPSRPSGAHRRATGRQAADPSVKVDGVRKVTPSRPAAARDRRKLADFAPES